MCYKARVLFYGNLELLVYIIWQAVWMPCVERYCYKHLKSNTKPKESEETKLPYMPSLRKFGIPNPFLVIF